MRIPVWARARAVVVAGGVIMACALAVVALSRWQPLPERSGRASATVDGPLGTVDIDLDRGTLVVEGAAGTESGVEVAGVEVDHDSWWRGWQPTVQVDVDDGTAVVVAECPWLPVVGSCSTDLHVVVPDGAHLRIRSGHGSVDLRNLNGWVEVDADGDLTGSDIGSPELLATSGGGDIDVAFTEPPSRIDVDSRGGDVLLEMPGGPYEADLAGDPVTNDVPTEELAERVVVVDGGRGAVTVRSSDG